MVNLAITMGIGKLFKFNIEEVVLACNANIGGPTTAAALAISKGWTKLVGPILVIGTVGYVVGNYRHNYVFFWSLGLVVVKRYQQSKKSISEWCRLFYCTFY